MLGNQKIKIVHDLVATLTKEEIIWLNGYLAGIVSVKPEISATPVVTNADNQPSATSKITLAFGTETGNAKKVATTFAAAAKKKGIQVKLAALDQYRLTDLSKEEWFFTVISTQGEGEPPLGAKKFYDFLHEEKPTLSKLKFGVLALGDTSYPLFCKAGEDVDAKLEAHGGKRVLPLEKCDVDYQETADAWFNKIADLVNEQKAAVQESSSADKVSPATVRPKGKKYYIGKVLTNINLNGTGSTKQTYHIEIGCEEKVEYEAGDSLAIVPLNRKHIVDEIIKLTGVDANQEVQTDKYTASVEELLTKHLNICYLLSSTVKKYGEITQQQIPDTRMDLRDLLRIYPVKDTNQFIEVLKTLKAIAPRLYSISSSPLAHDGEIHLTVSKNEFLLQDEQRFGLCSDFLGELATDSIISFYIHKNRAFKLPANDKDIIMIGPGVGVAPFRSFVAERDAVGAEGRSWLFFGDRNFTTDFLYQTEWQSYVSTGSLTKMNVAFSRDGREKLYVQQKIKQHAAEVFDWLEKGAYLYVCGAKDPMSVDVENTLLEIISEQKNVPAEEAVKYLGNLKSSGRYSKDVY
ncbi:MAG: sulfite reductase flavoprotein subunit alpha [Candidatus Dadabacteria bacterium]